MDATALYEQLISKLRLKSEATQVIIFLEEFLSTFFLPNAQADLAPYFENLRPEVAQILKDALEKAKKNDSTLVKKTIGEIEDKLRKSPVLQLTLAFQPDQDMIALFSETAKKQIETNMLLELHYDKAIVGGAVLIYKGKYKDYSLRKKLNDRFRIQKDEIMGMLK